MTDMQTRIKQVVTVNSGKLNPVEVQQVVNLNREFDPNAIFMSFRALETQGEIEIKDGTVTEGRNFFLDGDDTRQAVLNQQRFLANAPKCEFNSEEQRVNNQLIGVMHHITREWNVYEGNRGELAQAVHVIQMFIFQHMLQRVGGPNGEWYPANEL